MALRLVAGLGNPGTSYARTRHNAGLRLVEFLAGDAASWKNFKGLGLSTRQGDLFLAKPSVYMNESADFVCAFARFHGIAPEETLVCFDDLSIEFGRIKLRPSGSSGGQKGMKSIIDGFGTQDVPRLRLGIGPKPENSDAADYVLSPFSRAQEQDLPDIFERAGEAVLLAAKQGIEAAMNRFNSRGQGAGERGQE